MGGAANRILVTYWIFIAMADEPEETSETDKARGAPVDQVGNDGGRGPLIALGVIALIAVVGWLLFRELSASSRLQDCLLSGRTNCAPIEVPTR